MESRPVDFLTFFVLWSRHQGWTVPLLHVRICTWLEHTTDAERVLLVFRGAAKSTIYAVYKAWTLYRNRTHRSLVWAADGPTAGMLTADTINVMRNHPLCVGMLPSRSVAAKRFWVLGSRDARNASMRAVGVDSNATAARADAVDFDDVEVPGNVETPEARANLRKRISESTHIAVPGAQKTYIGTPHASDSIYPERIESGAAVLKIPLFEHSVRYAAFEADRRTVFPFAFPVLADGLYVFAGIGKHARLLTEGVDYRVRAGAVVFDTPPGMTVDVCSCNNWPERFTRADLQQRRKETRTLNAWDSQYMLEAKPVGEVRLDPARIVPYDVEPRFAWSNRVFTMWLGSVRIVGAVLRWDPSSGKKHSDKSGYVLDLSDDIGRHYWHRAGAVAGEIAITSDDGKDIVGGQVIELCDLIEKHRVPVVVVETNGIGDGAIRLLRMAVKQRRIACAVRGTNATANKNKRILEALQPLLDTRMLWAHVSVLDEGPLWDEMQSWNPAVPEQPDDILDAGSGAVTDQPGRIGAGVRNREAPQADDWRPSSRTTTYELVPAD